MRAAVELVPDDDPHKAPLFNIVVTPESPEEHVILSTMEQHPFNATMGEDEDGLPILNVHHIGRPS